ncbi:hypothetical protein D3C87_1855820 [compost metagenome]
MQAEPGVLAEQLFGAEVEVAAGEFDAVGERLAEVFFALEGEDVEVGVEAVDLQFVAAVVEEDGQNGVHVRTSLGHSGEASFPSPFKRSTAFRKVKKVDIGCFRRTRRMRPSVDTPNL